VNLERGSVLFHSPKGMGGGVIKSGGASAAVLGSTFMCATGADGTFKTIFLEGKACVVTLANGKSVTLHPGQMVVVLAGQTDFGPVLDIDLAKLLDTSLLLKGFSHDLDSLPLILAVIDEQKKASPAGTNYLSLLNKNSLDHNSQQTATGTPVSETDFFLQLETGTPASGLNGPTAAGSVVPLNTAGPNSQLPR
jgi:hypothetical protein